MSAQKATVAELKTEVETAQLTEEEKAIAPQTEVPQEIPPEPVPMSIETPTVPEVQPTPELEVTSVATHEPAPEPTPEPAEEQTVIDQQHDDMVYVEGFGWIESQGPNHADYAEDMYENGNKIGIMG